MKTKGAGNYKILQLISLSESHQSYAKQIYNIRVNISSMWIYKVNQYAQPIKGM